MALNNFDDDFGQAMEFANAKKNDALKRFQQKTLSVMDLKLKNELEDELLIGFQEDLPNFENNPSHNPITMKQINIIQQNNKNGILNTLLTKNIDEVIKKIKKYQDKMESSDIVVGRVISYILAETNDKKVKDYYLDTLQGTKLMKLELLDKYYLYPGKFIAASIENMDAKEWEVTKLHDFPVDKIEEEDVQLDTNKFRRQDAIQIIVAGGPFTFEDSDSYFPLLKLIGKIKAKQIPCDLLILLGPIVDQNNQKILDIDFDELFKEILKIVMLELPKVQILVVNSPNEATAMDALPQCPLKMSMDDGKQTNKTNFTNYQLLGNPVRFVLNDSLEIGIINADILSDLGRLSNRKGIQDKEKINWALKQFIDQESYVPVYPCSYGVDWNEINEELQLDAPFPNIIIIKSRLSPFAKLVDNTIFINSNSMCDSMKGYYGIITFHGNNSGNPKQNIRVDFNILK